MVDTGREVSMAWLGWATIDFYIYVKFLYIRDFNIYVLATIDFNIYV